MQRWETQRDEHEIRLAKIVVETMSDGCSSKRPLDRSPLSRHNHDKRRSDFST
jgi:hypothetical protein